MPRIKDILGRWLLDSRGHPTVEVEIVSEDGHRASAIVPSGASTGAHEAFELRDGDKAFLGKGVVKAVHHVNHTISSALIGFGLDHQRELDEMLIDMDGTAHKSRLGANAILGVSLAYAKLSAQNREEALYQHIGHIFGATPEGAAPELLPTPMMNILNGGTHADNNLDIQEFMIVPHGFATYSQALQAGVEIFHTLKAILQQKNCTTAVGDEGGFAPRLANNEEALILLCEAIEAAGYQAGKQVSLALDVAASEFYHHGSYTLAKKTCSAAELIAFYARLVGQYPIVAIEDGLAEDDWQGWRHLTGELGKKIQLVGDDLFVTNLSRLKTGIEEKVANAILIKPNQIGTLTETLDCIRMAAEAGYKTIISHRSGESEDTTIADLAVGTNAGQIKTGGLCRTDRTAKYNQLLRIESALAGKGRFAGQLR